MRRVKLGQICEVVSGGTPKTNVEEYWNGEFNWITPAEINDNDYIISDTKRKITQLAIEKKKLPLLPKGTVLLSSRAPIGKVAITGKEMYCNQGFKNLICSDEICNEYLYWYLKSKKEYLNSLGRGATFKEISKKIVENIEIKLPEIERQRKIVDKLKKVDKIIQRRKNQSRLLDVVVQARFVEMFGDPIINNMSWPESTIGDGCFVTKLAGFEYSKYIEYDDTGDVVMVKAQNVKNGTLNRKDLSFISNEVSDALPRSQLLPGDVVMTYVGANIGDVALIDDKYKYHLAPNVAKIRVDAKIYNSVYFMYMLMFLNSYIVKNSADTAKAALGMERIRKLKVFIPTYDLQNQFAAFVQQVNKSKFVIHKFLYCTTHNTQSIIKPRPNTKESGKTRGGKPYADEFDFLAQTDRFKDFAKQAAEAERSIAISPSTAAILSRRALELAVRWIYVHDDALTMPYRDNISSLIHEYSFRKLIQPKLFDMLKYTIKLGNVAVHTNTNVKYDAAVLSLRCVFQFCKWIDYCYGENYVNRHYDMSLLPDAGKEKKTQEELENLQKELSGKDQKLEEAIKENEKLRAQMTKLREENETGRSYEVDKDTEAETRRKYIDLDLAEAGWTIGKDCLIEVPVMGMPNSSGKGYADYVLYGNNGKPLAVIEAKRSSADPMKGSHQAKLYADCLENQYQQRPIIFITNGFEMQIIDDAQDDPQRVVSGIFSKEDLQRMVDQRTSRKPLIHLEIQDKITNRPYQKEAVTVLCESIMNHHRKLLLVQATGSGKTRVSISLVDVLRRHNYVKNILFLADRKALVSQAKKSYSNLLPDLTVCNLLENKEDPESSRMIFSTYPTMLNAIDETKKKDGKKLFTPAHFDLIIVDESHRSIYKKYQEIFHYFDAVLLGMTATPKDEIDKNTYTIFDLERGVPTYAYELDEAVKEGYLVDYRTREYKTKIMEEGIHYDQLSEEEKEAFDDEFDDDENVEKDIPNTAVNRWLFNKDTIDLVLTNLMREGLKVEGGDKLGKTIIFARNSKHAKAIVERFQKLFPEKGSHFIKQIDYSIKESEHLIEQFEEKDKMPQIAVSVDMLDTGIDVPEILNLVFFKKVRSYAKFCQMIGRGTRLCKDLLGPGMDKEKFLIFDYCNNFEYFRVNPHGKDSGFIETLSEKIFLCKARIARELQDTEYQKEEDFREYRNTLVQELIQAVSDLNDQSFVVKHHLKYVLRYRDQKSWDILETEAMADLKKHIAPIIEAEKENELARRFDYLMYSIELAMLEQKNPSKNIGAVVGIAEKLSLMQDSVPQIKEQKYILDKVQTNEFWEKAFILEMDAVREALRDLIQFLPKKTQRIVYTDFADQIIEYQENTPIEMGNRLENYRKKVEFYLKEHQDNMAVHKLRNNQPLQKGDMQELERILWQELGSKEDYTKEYGDTPVGILVRKITGMDRQAANEAFNEFLNEEKLNANQIRFVRLIVDYISVNGMIEDRKVMMDEPFRSVGSIGQIFENDMDIAMRIMTVIDQIKQNAEVTV